MMTAIQKIWFLFATVLLIVPHGALGDDTVGRTQAQAVVSAIFDRLDCGLEGTIDVGEVDEHFAQVWLPADIDRSRALSPGEYAHIHRSVPVAIGESLFQDADADADGRVTASELRLHLQRMIKTLDADGDNEVSRREAGLESLQAPKSRTIGFSPLSRDES